MAPIPVDRIISISSEEQTNKAENILKISDSHQTWRCKAGEKQATIIIQFLKPSVITSIDVGNDNSAFIEILAGKSTSDEFHVLLVTSSLMTLQECKNGLNINKVRFFDTNQLTSACNELWDRVKIVCTQPFIKQARFGLSFITFHSKDENIILPNDRSSYIQLGSFMLKNDDSTNDYLSAGQLFAKQHENKDIVRMPQSPMNRLLILHKQNLENGKNKNTSDSKKNNDHSPLTNRKVLNIPLDSVKPNKIDVNVEKNDSIISSVIKDKVKKNISISSSVNLQPSRKKIKVIKTPLPVTKTFDHLLDGVVFAMSGYENPYRSMLRSKALEMGAVYKNNWDQSCTHLICAFINTPKYNEAKRQGAYRVVKSDWIDKCHSNKCRFPWRRFALDKLEQNKPESEDEIHEQIESIQTNNTDDEWNDNPVRSPIPSTSSSQTNISKDQPSNIYDVDTDVDSDSEVPVDIDILADEENTPLPIIENIFRNCSFYLSTRLKPLIKKECYRYIIALEGQLSTKDKCDYIVSTDANNLKNTVTPQWIWDCYDASKILPLK